MPVQPPARIKGRKYRCNECHRSGVGVPGLIACPECGGELRALYYGNKRPKPKPRTVDDA